MVILLAVTVTRLPYFTYTQTQNSIYLIFFLEKFSQSEVCQYLKQNHAALLLCTCIIVTGCF